MKKYVLVSIVLLAGAITLPETGSAFVISNSTGGDITVTQKGGKAIILKKDEKSSELKNVPTTIAGGKDAAKLKAIKLKRVSGATDTLTISKENDKLVIKSPPKAK